jgi:hypothetical protein
VSVGTVIHAFIWLVKPESYEIMALQRSGGVRLDSIWGGDEAKRDWDARAREGGDEGTINGCREYASAEVLTVYGL